MGTTLALPEQRMLLHNVAWETYERLLADHVEAATPRFFFDRGTLEIMSPSSEHEEHKQALTMLVEMLADGLGIDIRNLGSTTFKRSELERGFEADVCFYVQNTEKIEGRSHVDPAVDPASDLVIEIEISTPALNKLPIYADFRVPEVWRYDGKRLLILRWHGNSYVESAESLAFPGASADQISVLVERNASLRRTQWLRELRTWIRDLQ